MRLAGNAGRKKSRQKSLSGHHCTTLSGYIFATKACVDNRKKMLSSNISSTCSHNIVNFGPLAAEIVSLVWGTQGKLNFNGFRVLLALLHGTLAVGVSQTATLNRRRHLYSAGRPSRWAFAHILVLHFFLFDARQPCCVFIAARTTVDSTSLSWFLCSNISTTSTYSTETSNRKTSLSTRPGTSRYTRHCAACTRGTYQDRSF